MGHGFGEGRVPWDEAKRVPSHRTAIDQSALPKKRLEMYFAQSASLNIRDISRAAVRVSLRISYNACGNLTGCKMSGNATRNLIESQCFERTKGGDDA